MSAHSRIEEKRVFGICGTGTFTVSEPGGYHQTCVCCGAEFKDQLIVVEFFEYDVVCADCVLSGPKEMAQRIRDKRIPYAIKEMEGKEDVMGWHVPYLTRMVEMLEEKESIADFPGGIFAVKIAEAYREIQAGKAT